MDIGNHHAFTLDHVWRTIGSLDVDAFGIKGVVPLLVPFLDEIVVGLVLVGSVLDDALDSGVAAAVDVEFGIGVEVVEQILLAVRRRVVRDELDVLEVAVEVGESVVVGRNRDTALVVCENWTSRSST